MARERGDPPGMCGCYGDYFVVEGSDELLTRLDAIMLSEFEAKLLSRVGKRTLARGGSELQSERRNPVRRGTRAVAWTQAAEQRLRHTP